MVYGRDYGDFLNSGKMKYFILYDKSFLLFVGLDIYMQKAEKSCKFPALSA